MVLILRPRRSGNDGMETKVTVLGIRSVVVPTAGQDAGFHMGKRAVDLLLQGEKNKMIAFKDMKLVEIELQDVIKGKKDIDLEICEIARILSI